MVRNYVRKTNRGSWSAEQINGAVTAVLDRRMSYGLAAKTFGIPPSTLSRKVTRARSIHAIGSLKKLSKITSNLKKEEAQMPSTCIIEQSDVYEEEDSTETENNYLESPNAIRDDPIAINNTLNAIEENYDQEIENKDDICELYGKLLAKKLRLVPENERLDIMYKIDGLLLNKLQRSIPSNSSS